MRTMPAMFARQHMLRWLTTPYRQPDPPLRIPPKSVQSNRTVSQQSLRQTTGSPRPCVQGTRGGAPDERDDRIKVLHAKIGELSMEKDFLSKALGRDL